jgi:hypothetical protein
MAVEKDSFTWQCVMAYFAVIAAWAGEKDLALQQLATAAPTPGASLITSCGLLKLMPFWDPLRGDQSESGYSAAAILMAVRALEGRCVKLWCYISQRFPQRFPKCRA